MDFLVRVLHAHLPDSVLEPGALAQLKNGPAVILAHGAGGHKDHPHILALAALLGGLGFPVRRFNFPYRNSGRNFPDSLPVLKGAWREEIAALRKSSRPSALLLAGHSLGGRVASQLAAEGEPCDGLLLFSYPLHAPGRPDKLRDGHLSDIRAPVLALSGTRDAFCEKALMEKVLRKPPKSWTQCWLEGADHGWAVPKKSGRTREDVLAEAGKACAAWLQERKIRPQSDFS